MSDFGGLFDVTAHGVRPGAGDTSRALAELAASIPASGGTMYFPPGDYAFAGAITTPSQVTLWFAHGARIVAAAREAPVFTIRGIIQAQAHAIFGPGVMVRFALDTRKGTTARAALASDVLPEWWGARGDAATDDTDAMQACIDACCGAPFESMLELPAAGAALPTTKGPPRWATARVRLGAGAVYRVSRPLHVLSVVGFAMTGAGMENSVIRGHGLPEAKPTAAGTTSLTRAGARWRQDELRDTWLCIVSGTGAGQSTKVRSNTSDTITFVKPLHVAPDASSAFVVLPESVLDLDGCFEGTFDRFSVEGASGAGAYTGIYYHRDPALTARGSSSTNFAFVKVGGLTWEAAWQIGGLDDRYDNYQEDITEFLNCRARGGGGPTYTGQWYRNGWVFGTGTFANNLNHTVHGIDGVRYGCNVSVRATNVAIYGGTLQSAGIADIQIVNGLQGYFSVSGIRSEGSRAFFKYPYNPYNVFWSVRLADIEINGPSLGGGTGGGDVIVSAAHYTELSGIRVLNPPKLVNQATGQGMRTSVRRAGAGAAWTPHEYAGWTWVATGGAGAGQTVEVADNTADTITFREALATAPDASTRWDVFVRPVIRVAKAGAMLRMSGVALAGGTIDRSIVAVGAANVIVDGFVELTYAGATIAKMWPGPIVLTSGGPAAASGAVAFGTLGEEPVARPTVRGTNPTETLNQLLAALAQLGLIAR